MGQAGNSQKLFMQGEAFKFLQSEAESPSALACSQLFARFCFVVVVLCCCRDQAAVISAVSRVLVIIWQSFRFARYGCFVSVVSFCCFGF